MKTKVKNTEIVIPILNYEYKVIVVWGTDRFINKVGRNWHYDRDIVLEPSMRGGCNYHPKCHPIIVLRGKPKTPTEIGTLSHEALHACIEIMNKISERSTAEEVLCHSLGAIVRAVLSHK